VCLKNNFANPFCVLFADCIKKNHPIAFRKPRFRDVYDLLETIQDIVGQVKPIAMKINDEGRRSGLLSRRNSFHDGAYVLHILFS
jgi:hypothetical protein